jgi:hypothetical protein
MKRRTCISYVGLSLQLYDCVKDLDTFTADLREWCLQRLQPDFNSDIYIELVESTPLK